MYVCRCQHNFDNCASTPCKNNGKCTDAHMGFSCECLPGFEGSDCSINIDDCQVSFLIFESKLPLLALSGLLLEVSYLFYCVDLSVCLFPKYLSELLSTYWPSCNLKSWTKDWVFLKRNSFFLFCFYMAMYTCTIQINLWNSTEV